MAWSAWCVHTCASVHGALPIALGFSGGMALPREAMLKCGVGFSPQDPLSMEQSEQDPR